LGRHVSALGFLSLVLVAATAACDVTIGGENGGLLGSGDLITESRAVSGFDEIVVLGSGQVIVGMTGTESLTIEAEDNIMARLTTEVRGGRLELGSEGAISPTRGITYTITAADLSGVEINGSGDVAASGVAVDSFDVTINGSGNVVVDGTTSRLDVAINGSGNYEGEGLVAPVGEVRISGSGSADVNVTDALTVRISGSGDVAYSGDPTLDQDISGSGNVSRR